MSIENLNLLSDGNIWKKLEQLKDVQDYNNECGTCGKPEILHEGVCTRSEKLTDKEPKEIGKLFRHCFKPIVKMMQEEKYDGR